VVVGPRSAVVGARSAVVGPRSAVVRPTAGGSMLQNPGWLGFWSRSLPDRDRV
jgi:hypothetical protein